MRRHTMRARTGHDRWLVSYADFITLLFAFFVVLYAFARADHKKQTQVVHAIDSAFKQMGVLPGASNRVSDAQAGGAESPLMPMNIVMGEEMLSPGEVKDDLSRVQGELSHSLAAQVASHTVSIQMGRDGLIVSLREAGFFASGSAAPKPEALPALRLIAASLSRTPYDLRVEGHTDNIPIHSAVYPTNWELSAARATSIARLLLELNAVPPQRLSAAGYAEFHPVATNSTAQGRALNRRVDLVVLPRTKIDFATQPGLASGPWRRIVDGDDSQSAQ